MSESKEAAKEAKPKEAGGPSKLPMLLLLVNTVCIGKIKSGQHERRIAKLGIKADDYYTKEGKPIPMGRFGEAEEAANAIVFLCSAPASYITGSSLNLDGGTSGVL